MNINWAAELGKCNKNWWILNQMKHATNGYTIFEIFSNFFNINHVDIITSYQHTIRYFSCISHPLNSFSFISNCRIDILSTQKLLRSICVNNNLIGCGKLRLIWKTKTLEKGNRWDHIDNDTKDFFSCSMGFTILTYDT